MTDDFAKANLPVIHDPLCPSDWFCVCDLIAKVRADERANVLNEAVAADGFLSARHAREWEDFVRKDEREKAAERVAGVDRDHHVYNRLTCAELMGAAFVAARGEQS
jgi:hypothetical protein